MADKVEETTAQDHIKKLLASLNEFHPEDCAEDGCVHCDRIIWAEDYLK